MWFINVKLLRLSPSLYAFIACWQTRKTNFLYMHYYVYFGHTGTFQWFSSKLFNNLFLLLLFDNLMFISKPSISKISCPCVWLLHFHRWFVYIMCSCQRYVKCFILNNWYLYRWKITITEQNKKIIEASCFNSWINTQIIFWIMTLLWTAATVPQSKLWSKTFICGKVQSFQSVKYFDGF